MVQYRTFASTILVVGLALMLAGCGTGGKWPRLSSKTPSDTDRSRDVTPVEAAAPAEGEFDLSLQEFNTARSEVETAQSKFLTAIESAKGAANTEERGIFLREAEIALTRVNMALTPLYPIADLAGGGRNEFEANVRHYVKTASGWLADARTTLEQL